MNIVHKLFVLCICMVGNEYCISANNKTKARNSNVYTYNDECASVGTYVYLCMHVEGGSCAGDLTANTIELWWFLKKKNLHKFNNNIQS